MKRFVKYMALACITFGMFSCVQDLNTEPIDPNSSTSFNQDRMFTKCYACMAVIGQSSTDEDSDVEGMDAGMSGFYRTIWYCNDLTTDEAYWIWDDDEARGLPTTNWTGESEMIKGIYNRLFLNIKYCNHYLTYAGSTSQEEQYRIAEVRWIRALHYYYLMDMFLYAPLVTTETSEYPHFFPRHEIYQWLVNELRILTGEIDDPNLSFPAELPTVRVSKYRVGKAAAQLLLARIYLNANVYNQFNPDWNASNPYPEDAKYAGKNIWEVAYGAASDVINDNPQHALVTQSITTDSGFVYSAYQRLFMGDNDQEEVVKEAIFQIYQDGLYTQSHAGSKFLIAGPRYGGMNAWGIEDQWHALRTSPTLVDKFLTPKNINRSTAEQMIYDEFQMPEQLGDDRAILCSYGMNTTDHRNFALTGWTKENGIGKDAYIYDSWAGVKFTGVYSYASLPKLSPRQSKDWPDTDIPLIRLAEAYLIQAEASFRMGNTGEALRIINNVIRQRANAEPLPSISADGVEILDEWCREFWFEGRRRTDLIRFGRFFGPDADRNFYHWEGRMGLQDNMPFKSGTPEYMNWFPIPSEDKRANSNFQSDVENDPNNKYATQGGDGYVY